MMLTVSNLAAYSIQLAVLVTVALITTRLVRLRAPRPSLRFWQSVVTVSLLLPFAGWQAGSAGRLLRSPATFMAASTPVARPCRARRRRHAVAPAGHRRRDCGACAVARSRLRPPARHHRERHPAPSLDAMAAELIRVLAARASLAVSDEIGTPATVGVRRAIVLLPRAVPRSAARGAARRDRHELVHVKRRDWLHTIAEECWCALLWFHPAARIIASRLSLARETVVDEMTIRARAIGARMPKPCSPFRIRSRT